jgi:hypothetical protein
LEAISLSLDDIDLTRILGGETTGSEDLTIHAQFYCLADKYFVKGLKKEVCEKFADCLDQSFAGSTSYEAVETVFTTTPETDTGLRSLVVKRISEEGAK